MSAERQLCRADAVPRHAAFDAGYVTFDAQSKIIFSKAVTGGPAYQLHLSAKMRINQKLLKPEHLVYLEHHRKKVFLG